MVIVFNVLRLEWPGEGPLFKLDSNRCRGPNTATVQIIPWTIIEVRPGPLARYCTRQETISGTPEQKCLPFDQDWIGLGRGHYSSRTRRHAGGKNAATIRVIPGSLLKSGLVCLARYCTHHETISGTPEQNYFHLTQDWNGLGRGHYSSRTQIDAGGPKCDHS